MQKREWKWGAARAVATLALIVATLGVGAEPATAGGRNLVTNGEFAGTTGWSITCSDWGGASPRPCTEGQHWSVGAQGLQLFGNTPYQSADQQVSVPNGNLVVEGTINVLDVGSCYYGGPILHLGLFGAEGALLGWYNPNNIRNGCQPSPEHGRGDARGTAENMPNWRSGAGPQRFRFDLEALFSTRFPAVELGAVRRLSVNAMTAWHGGRIVLDDIVVTPGPSADAVAPVTSVSADPAPNGAGWNNTPVQLSLNAVDDASGVTAITTSTSGAQSSSLREHPGAQAGLVIEAEGVTTVSYAARDAAGNVEQARSRTVSIDLTAPALSFGGNAGRYDIDQTISISCTASDSLAGIADATCPTVQQAASELPVGANQLTAEASDRAGNRTSATARFEVVVSHGGLCRLSMRLVPDHGLARSLCGKLEAAARSAARGDGRAARGQVEAYRNELRAQTGKKVSESAAATLDRLASAL